MEPERGEPPLIWAAQLHQPADALIRAIYEKRVPWAALRTASQQKLRCIYATVKPNASAFDAWQRLWNHLRRRNCLFSVEPGIPQIGPQPGNTGLDALLVLALRHHDWIRPPEAWQLNVPSPRAQIGSLARHLFARYEVPAFLDASWFEGFTQEGNAHRDWFLHIGRGQNIRTAHLPLRLTRMAAHHFLQAPGESSIVAAMRWGQVRGLDGDESLAQAVAASRLRAILPDEPFWASVLHFFVNNPRLDTSHVGPIVDYLFAQKFGEATLHANGMGEREDAPEPTLSMKGRKLSALLKRTEEWHDQLEKEAKRPCSTWNASGIEPFQILQPDPAGVECAWMIVELCNSRALYAEGQEMRHCVYSYTGACLRGGTSIWSLRVKPIHAPKSRRLLTIEVNNAQRSIVQVRARCNRTLGSYQGWGRMRFVREILRRWAWEQRLSIACAL